MSAETDSRQAEVWTYGGVRLTAKKQRIYLWIDAKGEQLYFKKISASTVGGQYGFDVERNADGRFRSVYGATRAYVNAERDNTELVERFQMEHRLAQAELARQQQERKAAAEPDAFDQAIDRLRELRAGSCRTRADRTAFLAMVIDALNLW